MLFAVREDRSPGELGAAGEVEVRQARLTLFAVAVPRHDRRVHDVEACTGVSRTQHPRGADQQHSHHVRRQQRRR